MKNKTSDKKIRKPVKPATQFSIDIDIKGMIFFASLTILTGIVIFYLGMLFGKASRNPNIPLSTTTEEVSVKKESEKKISTNDLEIYNIRTETDKIKSLKKSTKTALDEADRLLSESNSAKSWKRN